jgi:serine/threonine protein phosphatase PrpC
VPYRSFSATVTGISHTKQGKGCEDYSLHYPQENRSGLPVTLAVVADGHGDANCFRSARGAEFAAKSAKEKILGFVEYRNTPEPLRGLLGTVLGRTKPREPFKSEEFPKILRNLVEGIVKLWHDKVTEDHDKEPFTPEELAGADEKHRKKFESGEEAYKAYGSTLLAVAITPDYWFGFHIGDGRFTALYPDGTFDQPVPWDERCYLNVTTSICDFEAREIPRTCFSFNAEKEPPAAVFLCSDGVDDNYPVEENEKHLYKLYRTIALTFADDGFDSTCRQIEDLAQSFATKGKGDDTSIAGIIDMEAVKAIAPRLRAETACAQGAEERQHDEP